MVQNTLIKGSEMLGINNRVKESKLDRRLRSSKVMARK